MNDFTLNYYNTDDGIWLRHTRCGGVTHLGYLPSLTDALHAAQDHECKEKP